MLNHIQTLVLVTEHVSPEMTYCHPCQRMKVTMPRLLTEQRETRTIYLPPFVSQAQLGHAQVEGSLVAAVHLTFSGAGYGLGEYVRLCQSLKGEMISIPL